jgi:hypothetical protein
VQHREAQRAVREPLAQHDAPRADLHEADRHGLPPDVARRAHDARALRHDDARAPRDHAQRVADLARDGVRDARREHRAARDRRGEHHRDEPHDGDVLDGALAGFAAHATRLPGGA